MTKNYMIIGVVAVIVMLCGHTGIATADFEFLPAGAGPGFKVVGEKSMAEVKNTGAAEAIPALSTRVREDENGLKERYVNVVEPGYKECQKKIAAGATCKFEVEYQLERPNGKPLAEFWVVVEPPVKCPNMKRFTA
jgi:hypothetical protein